MKKARDMMNLPVIDLKSGTMVGRIKEIQTMNPKKITGFYLSTSDQGILYLPIELVQKIGRDSVLIDLNSAKELIAPIEALPEEIFSPGKIVMTSSGVNLGTIEDLIIEEDQGQIVGYEISDGYVKDLLVGRKVIELDRVLTQGNDALIIDDRYGEQEESKG